MLNILHLHNVHVSVGFNFCRAVSARKQNCSFCLSFSQDDSLFFVFWMITSCMLIALSLKSVLMHFEKVSLWIFLPFPLYVE